METTLQRLLSEIRSDLSDFDEPMDGPAPAAQLTALQADSASQLAYTLPSEYLELLATHDGIDCNGIQLYASAPETKENGLDRPEYLKRGFVEANLIWRDYEPNRFYAFFAESGDKLYCHNLRTNQFEIVDRITKTPIYAPSSFDTCEELLEKMLNHMLDHYDVAEKE